ncbi:MAG: AMP-binding protein, partial [Pseudomonadota bacterium]
MLEGCVPWPDELVKLFKKKGYWEDITIGEHIDRWVEKYADRTAIAYQGRDITYRELDVYVTRLAYHLAQMGIKTYDRVIFQLFNGPEVIYLTYACFKIGAIPICSLATHRWAEISFFAKTTEARAMAIPAGVVMDLDYEEFADELRNAVPSLKFVLTVGRPKRPNMVSINELLEKDVDLKKAKKELDKFRPDPMEPAVFQLSGGTTGVPKIIPRTHNDYYYNAKCCALGYDYLETDRVLTPQPMTHNAPLVCQIIPVHLTGGAVVPVAPRPENILQAVVQDKVNYLPLGGYFAKAVLGLPEEVIRKNFSGIRKLWCAMVIPEDLRKLRELMNCDSTQLFGMAEGLCTCTRNPDPLDIQINTQGRPVSEADEVKIIDPETLKELPVGEVGEMVCRGPYTLRGYYKAPERNKDAFVLDGFYRTGDLMKTDELGNLTWVGRIKDCIDRGGEKVNAEEVEEHIRKFSKVKEVAVVAMPDKVMNERICAYVVPRPGQTFTLEELRSFLTTERRIARFKAPERLEFIEALPVTGVGKLDKKVLRAKIAEVLKS